MTPAAESKRRVTADGYVVHVVVDEMPRSTLTACGLTMGAGLGYPRVWTLRPGDAHEICITCRRRTER